jgi:predicted nucleotidyltransferase
MKLSKEGYAKYQTAFEINVTQLQKTKGVIAVLIGGSFNRGDLQIGSDLDFIVLTDSNSKSHNEKYHETNGILVEVLEIPYEYAVEKIKGDRKKQRRYLSGIIAASKTVYGNKRKAESLIKKALSTYTAPVPTFTKKEREDLLFFLSKSPQKEQQLRIKNKPFAAQLRINHKLATCLEIAFCLEGKVIPHHKYWDSELKTFTDKKMARLLRRAALAIDTKQREDEWAKLVIYTIQRLK